MCLRRLAEPQQQSTLLLYGLQGTGKSLLSQALAAETGAALFDISPAVTDGKWPGKAVSAMLATVRLPPWPGCTTLVPRCTELARRATVMS